MKKGEREIIIQTNALRTNYAIALIDNMHQLIYD